jgi:hypothetical protein
MPFDLNLLKSTSDGSEIQLEANDHLVKFDAGDERAISSLLYLIAGGLLHHSSPCNIPPLSCFIHHTEVKRE